MCLLTRYRASLKINININSTNISGGLSRNVRCVGSVAHMEGMRHPHEILVRIPEENFWPVWNDNIEMDLEEIGYPA